MEVDNLLAQIAQGILPKDLEFYGNKLNGSFASIMNENRLYKQSKAVKCFGRVTFYKAKNDNTIKGIFLPIPFFVNQQKKVLEAIIKSYGEPYYRHEKMGGKMLYYPDFSLIIRIIKKDLKNGMVISIGEAGARLPLFDAKRLIQLYVKFILNYSKQESIDSLLERKLPTSIEHQEYHILQALCKAFISDDVKAFRRGLFINKRTITDYSEVIDQIKNTIQEKAKVDETYKFRFKKEAISLFDIRSLHNSLLSFCLDYQRYKKRSNRTGRRDWCSEYWRIMVQSVNQGMDHQQFEQMENMLALIIDPFRRKFDIKEMVHQFDYPKVDIEWMRANEY